MNESSDSDALYQTLLIKDIRTEIKDVKTFIFDEASSRKILYLPGQYLTLVYNPSQEAVRRSYSITSVPQLDELLSITVKRIDNGLFSRYLIDDAVPGDRITTTGAGGFFTLPSDKTADKQLFLLAAGSGIAPVYALLKAALYFYPYFTVVLLYSNHSPQETIFLQSLEHLKQQFPQKLQVQFLFSNVPDLEKARLYRELLLSLWKKYSTRKIEDQLFYICGPESYMRMCTYTLQGEGIPADNIKKENFNVEKRTPLFKEPPDKSVHKVTIYLRDKVLGIDVKYPATILQAAKQNGVLLPYSCEVGRCGNCVARCLEGSVWLSNNEVLTDKELKQGLVLTCVGYPVNGDVVLEIQ